MMGDSRAHLSTPRWALDAFDQTARSPDSPALNPSNIFLFPQKKKVLKGKHFANVEEVKQTNKQKAEALKGIQTDEFKNCFEQWKKMSQ